MKISMRALTLAALASIGVWLAAEAWTKSSASPELVAAAERMVRATDAVRAAKRALGLLQPDDIDRNRTGLIGPEWSEITTTIGLLDAKRTLTNPDLAALVARVFAGAGLTRGDRIAVVLSGSFVGGNVAVLAAIETLGLDAHIVSSLAASMFGATDPSFTWLDIEAVARTAGVWTARSAHAVLGGESGRARDLAPEARAMLRAAASRNDVPIVDEPGFEAMVDALVRTLGLAADARPKLLVNAGGAQVALGTCAQAESIPAGLVRERIACSKGTPGLVQRALEQGIPVLNLFKVKDLARRYGLPYDPVPLPEPGTNRAIYRR